MRVAYQRGGAEIAIPESFVAQYRARGFSFREYPVGLPHVSVPTPVSELPTAAVVASHSPPAVVGAPDSPLSSITPAARPDVLGPIKARRSGAR